MAEFRLVKARGAAISIYPAEESIRELRRMLNAAWDKGEEFGGLEDYYKPTRPDRRYRDVSKIIREAKRVDWTKLNQPDNVEEQP